jgi:DNA-binding NtrC family response regulator
MIEKKLAREANLETMLSGLVHTMNKETENGARLSLRQWMDLAESWRIWEALRLCRGNRSAAARQLGIGRRTLYAKIDRLGISFSELEVDEPSPLARSLSETSENPIRQAC